MEKSENDNVNYFIGNIFARHQLFKVKSSIIIKFTIILLAGSLEEVIINILLSFYLVLIFIVFLNGRR